MTIIKKVALETNSELNKAKAESTKEAVQSNCYLMRSTVLLS